MTSDEAICPYVSPDGERGRCELSTGHQGTHLRWIDDAGTIGKMLCCVRCGVVSLAHEGGKRRHAFCKANVLAMELRERGLRQAHLPRYVKTWHELGVPVERHPTGPAAGSPATMQVWIPVWAWRLLMMTQIDGTSVPAVARKKVIRLLVNDPVAQTLAMSRTNGLRRLLAEAMAGP